MGKQTYTAHTERDPFFQEGEEDKERIKDKDLARVMAEAEDPYPEKLAKLSRLGVDPTIIREEEKRRDDSTEAARVEYIRNFERIEQARNEVRKIIDKLIVDVLSTEPNSKSGLATVSYKVIDKDKEFCSILADELYQKIYDEKIDFKTKIARFYSKVPGLNVRYAGDVMGSYTITISYQKVDSKE